MKPVVLVVDDDAEFRESLKSFLEAHGWQVLLARHGKEGLEIWAQHAVDVILLDLMMPVMDGWAFLEKADPSIPILVLTGHGDVEKAVQAMKAGAYDFLEKPPQPEALLQRLSHAWEHHRLDQENQILRDQEEPAYFVGISPAVKGIRQFIQKVASSPAPVLLLGETGVGKEVVARAIHQAGVYRPHPFVVVNCSALPEHLVESELFGHEKGAFTDARKKRRGKFALAHRGILFLDEIGDMPRAVQPKLLRALERGEITPLGSEKSLKVKARVIAATNRDASRHLREDLYYRLSTLTLTIPPLRERKEDIRPLGEYFIEKLKKIYRKPFHLTDEAWRALEKIPWRGNARELRNFLERLMLLGEKEVMDEVWVWEGAGESQQKGRGTLAEALEEYERKLILQAIKESKGVLAEAARRLGVERSLLYRKMKRLKIEPKKVQGDLE